MSGALGGDRERPRPQYGEYATPEEQRAHIRQPDAREAQTPPAAQPAQAQREAAPTAEAPAAPLWDRILTLALLGYGLFTVLTAIPSYTDYAQYAEVVLGMFEVEVPLSDPAGANAWGLAAALVMGIGWLATAAWAILTLRRGRRAWWVPLVGGVVVSAIAGLLLVIPLVNDQAVWAALVSAVGGG